MITRTPRDILSVSDKTLSKIMTLPKATGPRLEAGAWRLRGAPGLHQTPGRKPLTDGYLEDG